MLFVSVWFICCRPQFYNGVHNSTTQWNICFQFYFQIRHRVYGLSVQMMDHLMPDLVGLCQRCPHYIPVQTKQALYIKLFHYVKIKPIMCLKQSCLVGTGWIRSVRVHSFSQRRFPACGRLIILTDQSRLNVIWFLAVLQQILGCSHCERGLF